MTQESIIREFDICEYMNKDNDYHTQLLAKRNPMLLLENCKGISIGFL